MAPPCSNRSRVHSPIIRGLPEGPLSGVRPTPSGFNTPSQPAILLPHFGVSFWGMAHSTPDFPFEQFRRLRFGGRPACPHCSHDRVHRWGGFAGRRRYRCTACGRTFSDFTGSPLAALKHVNRWPAFCHCSLASLSVRRTGRLLGVDKGTAFRWRHRLLAALDASDYRVLIGSVMVDETSFRYSEKGRRRSTRMLTARAWVCVARDGGGIVATGLVGLRRPGAAALREHLEARLAPDVILESRFGAYGATGLLSVRLGLPYRLVARGSPEVWAMRRYVMALRSWLKPFRGVATRYLQHYLAWHRFLDWSSAPGSAGSVDQLLAGRFP